MIHGDIHAYGNGEPTTRHLRQLLWLSAEVN